MTLDELARLVVDKFARLETRLDTVLPTLTAAQEDHEQRIRRCERLVPDDLPAQLDSAKRFRWILLGAASGTGMVGGGIAAAILRAVM